MLQIGILDISVLLKLRASISVVPSSRPFFEGARPRRTHLIL
jgi:hypothetical protein